MIDTSKAVYTGVFEEIINSDPAAAEAASSGLFAAFEMAKRATEANNWPLLEAAQAQLEQAIDAWHDWLAAKTRDDPTLRKRVLDAYVKEDDRYKTALGLAAADERSRET